jgi:uracil-DNA glycosylase
MSIGRINKNPSWINDKNEYDVQFVVPSKWENMFNEINLDTIKPFLNKELIELGDHIPIYPPKDLVFNTFNLTSPENLKVVILGQDPYINEGEAMGLAFSVPEGKKIPPSLRNIYKKLNNTSKSGDLTSWAEQGVLLLNTALTVRAHSSNSHSSQWRKITNNIIKYLSENFDNLVFILWGGNAFSKIDFIDRSKHSILVSSHPSPLGCSKPMKGNSSFNDSDHFNKCNEILKHSGRDTINFKIQ